jgi:hypothetical protein
MSSGPYPAARRIDRMQPPLQPDPDRRSGPDRELRPVRLFARNRRDGARLLSSSLVITVIALVAWSHLAGKLVACGAGLISLHWWWQYRQLQQ